MMGTKSNIEWIHLKVALEQLNPKNWSKTKKMQAVNAS